MSRANSFLLSMASPVLHKMMCSGFMEGLARRVSLDDVDGKSFRGVLDMWCGKEGHAEELSDAMIMASVADRLQMLDIVAAVEDAIVAELSPKMCTEVLMSSRRLGLMQVEEAAWNMAVERFEEVSKSADFVGLDEETVGRLLDEDRLGVRKEDEAFEGLMRWLKGGTRAVQSERELLRKIRFGMMKQEYLEVKVREIVTEEHRGWIEDLVVEALRAKTATRGTAQAELQYLGAKALTRRRARGVEWGQYPEGGGGNRLRGHSGSVRALVECEGRMCSGSGDGSIRVWNLANLEQERVLQSDGYVVRALAVWGGEVLSGHTSGRICAWDLSTGVRRRALDGHIRSIESLCVCGSRLASGSWDCLIKVWAMGPEQQWPCERTLAGHSAWVQALAGWGGKLISGSGDDTIRVWDLTSGRLDATLTGHEDTVYALLVHSERLFSTSADQTIRVWALGTWAAITSVQACCCGAPGQYPRCLVACGSTLISGSSGSSNGDADEDVQYEVRVWDAETMECRHTLRQAVGAAVWCLATVGGEVWGGVGSEVVVWGAD